MQVKNDHSYEKSLIETVKFDGYNCMNDFCNWLFDAKNKNSMVFAHNAAGYDNKFVIKWCLEKCLPPSKYIRQGSRITLMTLKKI